MKPRFLVGPFIGHGDAHTYYAVYDRNTEMRYPVVLRRTRKAAKAWVLNMRKEVAATRRRSRRLAARVTGEALP